MSESKASAMTANNALQPTPCRRCAAPWAPSLRSARLSAGVRRTERSRYRNCINMPEDLTVQRDALHLVQGWSGSAYPCRVASWIG